MNFCREVKTASELLQIFLGRFQLLPQHCPAALNLGFKFIVRDVHYHPNFPFVANQSAMPFQDEASATKFHQQKMKAPSNTFQNLPKKTANITSKAWSEKTSKTTGPPNQLTTHF